MSRWSGKVICVAAGDEHSGIVTPSAVVTWGGRAPLSGDRAEVALSVLDAAQFGGAGSVRALSLGLTHAVALTGAGEAFFWGHHADTEGDVITEPTRVTGVLYGTRVTAVLALRCCTFALSSAGSVFGWGLLPGELGVSAAPRLLVKSGINSLHVSRGIPSGEERSDDGVLCVTRAQSLEALPGCVALPPVLSQLWIASVAATAAFCVVVGTPVPRDTYRLLRLLRPEDVLLDRYNASLARLCGTCVEPDVAAEDHGDRDIGITHAVAVACDGALLRVPTYIFASRSTVFCGALASVNSARCVDCTADDRVAAAAAFVGAPECRSSAGSCTVHLAEGTVRATCAGCSTVRVVRATDPTTFGADGGLVVVAFVRELFGGADLECAERGDDATCAAVAEVRTAI